MDSDDKKFGKKVFFLNFPNDFRDNVISALIAEEIEIYTLDVFKQAKNTLRLHSNSICFVCIDSLMSVDEWFNFVKSFSRDPMLSNIVVGVASAGNDIAVKSRFLKYADISAGFISLRASQTDIFGKFLGILTAYNVKGSRKYLRVNCSDDILISAECTISNIHIPIKINDISSIGISCSITPKLAPIFVQNAVVRDITISLRMKKIVCSAIVLIRRPAPKSLMVVMIFTKGMAITAKKIVREYIRAFLQRKVELSVSEMPPDETDYSQALSAEISPGDLSDSSK